MYNTLGLVINVGHTINPDGHLQHDCESELISIRAANLP